MRVLAFDPYADAARAGQLGVDLRRPGLEVRQVEAFGQAHMILHGKIEGTALAPDADDLVISRRSADRRVRIQMPGSAESLNVASAAAVCLNLSSRAQRD